MENNIQIKQPIGPPLMRRQSASRLQTNIEQTSLGRGARVTQEVGMRKSRVNVVLVAAVGLLVSVGLATPTRAETGAVSVVFTKGGFIVGVGGGQGVLTFRGKHYPFTVSGMSVGFTVGASTTKFVGRALNLHSPGDLAGSNAAARRWVPKCRRRSAALPSRCNDRVREPRLAAPDCFLSTISGPVDGAVLGKAAPGVGLRGCKRSSSQPGWANG